MMNSKESRWLQENRNIQPFMTDEQGKHHIENHRNNDSGHFKQYYGLP